MRFVSAVHNYGRRLNQSPFRPRAEVSFPPARQLQNTTEKRPLLAGNFFSRILRQSVTFCFPVIPNVQTPTGYFFSFFFFRIGSLFLARSFLSSTVTISLFDPFFPFVSVPAFSTLLTDTS